MRNITALVLGTLLLVSAGKVRALTPLPSCVTDKDCITNYRCVYSGDSKSGQCKYVAATSTPTVNTAALGESCGMGTKGSIKCGDGLKCELTKYTVTGSNGKLVTKVGINGKCVSNKVTPSPKTNCSMKKCGDSNCDGQVNSLDLMLWMRERAGTGKNSDFNSDGKVDLKDYDLLRAGMSNKCNGGVILPRVTVVPTKIIEGPKNTPVVSRFCNTDNDCMRGQVCYQPPMPTCAAGTACAQAMPKKYCKGIVMTTPEPARTCASQGGFCKSKSEVCGNGPYRYAPSADCLSTENCCVKAYVQVTPTGLPVTGISTPRVCRFTGDADGDGKTTLKDYAIWKYEYSSKKVSKGDFNCDNKVDINDYSIWKKIFLESKNLTVIKNN